MPVLDEDAAQLLDYLPSALSSVVTWTAMPSAVLLMSNLAQPWDEHFGAALGGGGEVSREGRGGEGGCGDW